MRDKANGDIIIIIIIIIIVIVVLFLVIGKSPKFHKSSKFSKSAS